jgi:uncharacterized protein (DUF1501 family)
LFSHSDQVTQWQTSVPDQPALTGWSGRCADLMNSVNTNAPISMSVSLAGANTMEVGNVVSEYSVSTSGAIALNGVNGARLAALTNILGLAYPNMQASAYAGVAGHSIATGALLNNAITNTLAANYWTNAFPSSITTPNGGSTFGSSLSSQLKMIARLIEAGHRAAGNPSNGFGMLRQIFFCQAGGYDLHSGQTNYTGANPNNVILGAHANLFAEVSQCLLVFQRAMEQLALQNKVTTFTAVRQSANCQRSPSTVPTTPAPVDGYRARLLINTSPRWRHGSVWIAEIFPQFFQTSGVLPRRTSAL